MACSERTVFTMVTVASSVARIIDQQIHAYKNKNNTGILSITLLEGQDVFAYANSEPGVTFLVAVITSVVGS